MPGCFSQLAKRNEMIRECYYHRLFAMFRLVEQSEGHV